MAFAAARPDTDTMSEMNITPLVDVMLVLLVIFMVTAPLMDFRIGMGLPQRGPEQVDRKELQLQVEAGDMFRLDGAAVTPRELEAALADWRMREPEGVLKLAIDPEADYQSAATAMAAADRAGVVNIGLVEP